MKAAFIRTPNARTVQATVVAAVMIATTTPPAAAQDAAVPEPILSMGQPSRWAPYAGAALGLNELGSDTGVGGTALLGIRRALMNPLTGGPTPIR